AHEGAAGGGEKAHPGAYCIRGDLTMDAPPVNRLLQLLRQKPSETSEPSHASQALVSPGASISQSIPQSNILSATESDTLETCESNILSATESDTQPALQGNRQPV